MLLNWTPEVPFKLMSKLPPISKLPPLLLFNIALAAMLPDEPLVMVTAPELFHTAPEPSVKPPDGTETLPVVVSVPSSVPPVHEKLLVVIAPPTISSVPPVNASVPVPLTGVALLRLLMPLLKVRVAGETMLKVPLLVPSPDKVSVPVVTFTPFNAVELLLNTVLIVLPLVETFDTFSTPAPVLLNALVPVPPFEMLNPSSPQVPVLLMVAPLLRLTYTALVPFTVCDTAPCVFSVVPFTFRLEELFDVGISDKAPVTVKPPAPVRVPPPPPFTVNAPIVNAPAELSMPPLSASAVTLAPAALPRLNVPLLIVSVGVVRVPLMVVALL